jgi:cysteine-rich repeat protein
VISTTSPLSGTKSLEMHRDPALGDNMLWGVFSPILTGTRQLKQEVSVWIQLESGGGPDYGLMIQSPTDGFVSVWSRFMGDGDVEVLMPTGMYLSTGFNWLNEIGAGEYFEVVFTMDRQAPTSTQVSIEINGTTIFNGAHVGSDFYEQLVLLTNNTGPNDVALFADDIAVEHQFLLNDCDSDGEPDACEVDPPDCPVCGDGVWEGIEQCDDGNIDDNDPCTSNCEVQSERRLRAVRR